MTIDFAPLQIYKQHILYILIENIFYGKQNLR